MLSSNSSGFFRNLEEAVKGKVTTKERFEADPQNFQICDEPYRKYAKLELSRT